MQIALPATTASMLMCGFMASQNTYLPINRTSLDYRKGALILGKVKNEIQLSSTLPINNYFEKFY